MKKERMTKKKQVEDVQGFNRYAASVNVYQKPRRGLNSGLHGNAFEQAGKLAIGNYQFKGVAKPGRADSRKKIDGTTLKIEFKSGAGELAVIDENGLYISGVWDSDIVVYAPEFNPMLDVTKQAYVFSTFDFIKVLNLAGLVRMKASSDMKDVPEEFRYKDRITIQSFKNSNKKYNLFYELLKEYGVSFEKWIQENIK